MECNSALECFFAEAVDWLRNCQMKDEIDEQKCIFVLNWMHCIVVMHICSIEIHLFVKQLMSGMEFITLALSYITV